MTHAQKALRRSSRSGSDGGRRPARPSITPQLYESAQAQRQQGECCSHMQTPLMLSEQLGTERAERGACADLGFRAHAQIRCRI